MKLSLISENVYSFSQDGAVFGDHLFRIDAGGNCLVFDLRDLKFDGEKKDISPVGSFALDKAALICPHSNAVSFGSEYADPDDEFPVMYTNVYNNYAKAEDKRVGVCCVYRIIRGKDGFSSQLLQTVEIGFTDDCELWRSPNGVSDVRPYGNFLADAEKGKYYAFVMRDGAKSTRYFTFDLPRLSDGVTDPATGVKRVYLKKEDILEYFDTPYHNYVQGACVKNGRIYSVEGFGESVRPALRIIDLGLREEIFNVDLYEAGYIHEPELIDHYGDRLLYSDHLGNLFSVEL